MTFKFVYFFQSWALFSELRVAVADCVTFDAVSAICIPYFKYNGRAANAIRIFESKKFMSSASAICFSKLELILGKNVGLFYCVATQKQFFPLYFLKKRWFSATVFRIYGISFLAKLQSVSATGTEQDRLHLQSVFTKRVTRSQK